MTELRLGGREGRCPEHGKRACEVGPSQGPSEAEVDQDGPAPRTGREAHRTRRGAVPGRCCWVSRRGARGARRARRRAPSATCHPITATRCACRGSPISSSRYGCAARSACASVWPSISCMAQVVASVQHSRTMDRGNAWIADAGGDLGLTPEPIKEARVLQDQVARQDLERDLTASEGALSRAVDGPHRAPPQELDDLEVAQGVAAGEQFPGLLRAGALCGGDLARVVAGGNQRRTDVPVSPGKELAEAPLGFLLVAIHELVQRSQDVSIDVGFTRGARAAVIRSVLLPRLHVLRIGGVLRGVRAARSIFAQRDRELGAGAVHPSAHRGRLALECERCLLARVVLMTTRSHAASSRSVRTLAASCSSSEAREWLEGDSAGAGPSGTPHWSPENPESETGRSPPPRLNAVSARARSAMTRSAIRPSHARNAPGPCAQNSGDIPASARRQISCTTSLVSVRADK